MTFLTVLSEILLSMLMVPLFTLSVSRHLNWLQNLNLIYETLWTGAGGGLLISMLEKRNYRSNNTGAINVKIDGSVLEEKSISWGWLSLLNWIGALTLSLLLKVPPKKLEPWFVLWNFFPLRLLCISINLPYNHAWNTVVMSGLVLLVATWNC